MRRTTAKTTLASSLLGFALYAMAAENLPVLGRDPLEEVVAAMTLQEKVRLLSSNGYTQPGEGGDYMALGHPTYAISRLGIPQLIFNDGPAGIHFSEEEKDDHPATAFPDAVLIASSWNVETAEAVGQALGHEVKEYGMDLLLAPGMNAHRHPLQGRFFEYYSEDPLISGEMAAAFVAGVQSNGVGTSLKHFVANEQETHRNLMRTHVSERALRELYLKSFKIAIQKSSPWSVMTSLNLVNGVYTSENRELLDTVLRQEWGFDGFVMTDWFGGKNAVAQVIAGNDLLTPGGSSETLTPGKRNQEEMILEAVKAGKLPESTLDRNVTRYLKAVLKSPTMRGYQRSGKPDLQRDAQVARAAATDGIILLKNEGGTLPLHKEIDRIALFGNASYRLITGGTGSGFVWVANQNPIAEALASTGYRIDERLKATYHGYLTDYDREYPRKDHVSELFNPTPPAPEMAVDPELIKDHAEKFDIAIVTLGRVSGENLDRERDDFSLTRQERTLIEAVSDAFHANGKKVIVVLNIGGMIDIASWRDKADAIVLPWLPGQEGGNAVVDILTGRVTPSGKLATTYPLSLEQVPADDNFPGTLYPELAEPGFMTYKYIPGEVTYEEGIFSGYRYHDTFNKVPAYPFGYGLSYTRFALSDLQVSAPEFAGVMDVSVTVTNTGERHGKEVVQLYLGAPANKLEKPRKELKAFSKTRQLAPGDSQRVTLTLQGMDLASFDPGQSAWVAEAGRYLVQLGTDVSNIVLTGSFTLDRDRIIETTNPVLVPVRQINEIGSRQAH